LGSEGLGNKGNLCSHLMFVGVEDRPGWSPLHGITIARGPIYISVDVACQQLHMLILFMYYCRSHLHC
jgi:hypothetical protein